MTQKKNFQNDYFEPRIRMPDKGRAKIEKHRNQLKTVAALALEDDDVFDDYFENELDSLNRNKRR